MAFKVALKGSSMLSDVITLPLARPPSGTLTLTVLALTRGDRQRDERTRDRALGSQEGGRGAARRLRRRTRHHLQRGGGHRHGDRRRSRAGDKGGAVGNLPDLRDAGRGGRRARGPGERPLDRGSVGWHHQLYSRAAHLLRLHSTREGW